MMIHVYCTEHPSVSWQVYQKPFNPSDINLWNIPLNLRGLHPDHLWELLSNQEKASATRIRHDKSKEQFMLARACVRILLSQHFQMSPKDIVIETDVRKKPCLAPDSRLEFNISHSNDRIALIVSNHRVGVDVEYANRLFNFNEVIDTCCTRNEIAYIVGSADQVQAFFNIWTRKESLLKALGIGISDHMRELPCLTGHNEVYLESPYFKENWQIMNILTERPYALSIAFPHANLTPKLYHITHFEQLSPYEGTA